MKCVAIMGLSVPGSAGGNGGAFTFIDQEMPQRTGNLIVGGACVNEAGCPCGDGSCGSCPPPVPSGEGVNGIQDCYIVCW